MGAWPHWGPVRLVLSVQGERVFGWARNEDNLGEICISDIAQQLQPGPLSALISHSVVLLQVRHNVTSNLVTENDT